MAVKDVRQGYEKSETTRAAIIAAGHRFFGAQGFNGATTRAIAEAAGVALPAIAYHFGGKEGLYLACAEDILSRYYAETGQLALQALTALSEGPGEVVCRDYLRRILKQLLRVFVQPDEGDYRADFVTRELRDRGPAFQRLYDGLWQPGVDLVARLVAGIGGRTVVADDQVDALMLISSLLAFNTGRDVTLRILALDRFDADAFARLDAAIDRLVAGI